MIGIIIGMTIGLIVGLTGFYFLNKKIDREIKKQKDEWYNNWGKYINKDEQV